MSKIDEVFRKALNDEDILVSKRDRRRVYPKLFKQREWRQLRDQYFNAKTKSAFHEIIKTKIHDIKTQPEYRDWKSELTAQAKGLQNACDQKPYLLEEALTNFAWYGAMECNLPSMDDYGKIIERYDPAIVEQYFVDKIARARKFHKKALAKVLEYVKELYDAEVSLEEIAFFVRKLNSLEEYWEVII